MARLNIFEFGYIDVIQDSESVSIEGECPDKVFFCYFINYLDSSSIHYIKLEFPKDYCKFNIITTKTNLNSFISILEQDSNIEINILGNALKHLL
jgi:hypothetical protein